VSLFGIKLLDYNCPVELGRLPWRNDPGGIPAAGISHLRLYLESADIGHYSPSHITHHSSGTYGMINTTISKGKGVAGEWEYVMAPPPPEGAEKPKKEEITPFRPSNAHVAKRTNHIPYLHDPLDPKLQKEHDRKVSLLLPYSLPPGGCYRQNLSNPA
jgi:hypothetical protein